MDNASKAHREYTGGKIDSSEFLRRIDTWQELRSYDVKAMPLVVDTTVWQQRERQIWDHAPADSFPEQIMFLVSPTDGSPAQWEMKTRDQLRREAQKGHQSLRDSIHRKKSRTDGCQFCFSFALHRRRLLRRLPIVENVDQQTAAILHDVDIAAETGVRDGIHASPHHELAGR